MKVAFDFDSTLSEGDVQHFVKQLKDFEVWVVTSRLPDDKAPNDNWNNDLWWVCNHLDIPKDRVVFTSYSSKHEFFWGKDFVFHLDDDIEEVEMINKLCDNTIGVLKHGKEWKSTLTELINHNK